MLVRAFRLVVLILIAFASAGGRAANAGFSLRDRLTARVPFEFGPGSSLFAADMDGDGEDELVRAVPGRALFDSCWADGRRLHWDVQLDSAGTLQMLADATGDRRPDLLVVSPRDGGYVVSCHDPSSPRGPDSVLWSAGPYLQRCRIFEKQGVKGVVKVMGVLDADGDGRPEVYVHVLPFAPGVEPRRLLCLDGVTGKERWRHDLAGHMTDLRLLVRTGGRERRLIYGTYSPQNGFTVGEEDDQHCYVTCLSPAGVREWSVKLGGGYCAAVLTLLDLDGDGSDDIIATTNVAGTVKQDSGAGEGRLLVLEPSTGVVRRNAVVGPILVQLAPAGRDGGRGPGILAVDRDGRLRCRNRDLSPRWVSSERPIGGIVGVADLDGDARPEILCRTGSSLQVLDMRGRLRVARDVPGAPVQVAVMRSHGRDRLALAGGTNGSILAFEPPTVPPSGVVAGVVLLVGGTWTSHAVIRRRRRRAEALVERGEAQDRLLEAMVAFGHAGSSLGVLDRLRFHLRNWDRVLAQDGGENRLAPLLDDFVGSVLPDIVRLVSLARRADVKSQHWRSLATQALQASGELQQLVERGSGATDGRVQRVDAALERLDSSLRGIRAHLRQVFRAEVEPLVRRVLARRAGDLAAAGVEVRMEDGGPVGQAAFVSGGQLEKVLENMVENALRAMQETATRRLAVALRVEGAHCLVDVADSGRGIPLQDHERVFDRDYSTREGGGFGLYYARQVLARYEGKIFVLASGPGAGTTFRIVLRTS